jgi:hypothetical protein
MPWTGCGIISLRRKTLFKRFFKRIKNPRITTSLRNNGATTADSRPTAFKTAENRGKSKKTSLITKKRLKKSEFIACNLRKMKKRQNTTSITMKLTLMMRTNTVLMWLRRLKVQPSKALK